MASTGSDYPKPKFITGGCLCGTLRYRVDFPPEHDFDDRKGTCQCTQCRRNTSALVFIYHQIAPFSAFKWEKEPSTLKEHRCTPQAARTFCGACGSWMYWKHDVNDRCSFTVGTIDPLYLWGEGAGEGEEGKDVPKGGFARALLPGEKSSHEWCGNEIKGFTDPESMPMLGRGERVIGESDE